MKLISTLTPTLPSLAWACTLPKGAHEVHLEHGPGVDVSETHFFEGAWAGDFKDAGFLEQPCFGSGARIQSDHVILTPPDHNLERLFYYRTPEALVISNSLAMLMARCAVSLQMGRADYHVLFTKMLAGISEHETELPIEGGGAVVSWLWHHMRITPDLEIHRVEKDRRVDFSDYAKYESYLSQTMKAVFDNAADPSRQARFEPITTISSGYDSTAITALAADLGCRDAITFPASRGKLGKKSQDDSGAEASQILNLNVHAVDRLNFRTQDGLPEIEGYGVGTEMMSARAVLKDKVLLTGFLGDTIWDRIPPVLTTTLALPTIAGHNLTEFRLNTGFIMFPVPFIGCLQQPDVAKISQSDEMKPWAMMNDYDRPICRRIAEERGIPREAFGMEKKAAGVYFREEGLENTMTPQSYADYSAFRLAHTGVPLKTAQRADKQIEWIRFGNSVLRKITKGINKIARTSLTPPKMSDMPGIKTQGALLFQWSMSHLVQRYK